MSVPLWLPDQKTGRPKHAVSAHGRGSRRVLQLKLYFMNLVYQLSIVESILATNCRWRGLENFCGGRRAWRAVIEIRVARRYGERGRPAFGMSGFVLR